MRLFKFGGASVRDAEGIMNLFNIVSEEDDRLVVVVSAFGKTTNALEQLHLAWRNRDPVSQSMLGEISDYHIRIAEQLFAAGTPEIQKVENLFSDFGIFYIRQIQCK